MRFILFSVLMLTFSFFGAFAQNTVGTIVYEEDAMDGYTFFSPFSSTKAFMVDNCGNLINEWDRGTRPGLSAYFLDNGLMFRTYKADKIGPFTSASNAGGLELVDWDNNTVWSYEINTEDLLSHHDAVMMDNGNILVLTWKLIYADSLVAWGRDPNEIAQENYMWSERIVELEPVGTNEANIIWEWNIYDHYIQDVYSDKANYGVVSEHPELFDINLPELNSDNSNSTRDWNHFNAIDYHETHDQILLSVRNSDEIWILDHSTTTEEAATHQGGTYGKGGDILYRWGNANAYKTAEVSAQQLFGQHGVNWIDDSNSDANFILIYNNGNGRPGQDYSQIDILEPPIYSPGFYAQEGGLPNGPDIANTIYGDVNAETFYSAYLSNAQKLINGNTLINAGSPGRIFEINENREIVWAYEIPLFGDFPASQGDNVNNNGNFRAYKYSPDFAGFTGVDIVPGLPIETNPTECEIAVSIKVQEENQVNVYYSSSTNMLHIESTLALSTGEISIYNASGQIVYNETINSSQKSYSLPLEVTVGMYFVQYSSVNDKGFTKKVLVD